MYLICYRFLFFIIFFKFYKEKSKKTIKGTCFKGLKKIDLRY